MDKRTPCHKHTKYKVNCRACRVENNKREKTDLRRQLSRAITWIEKHHKESLPISYNCPFYCDEVCHNNYEFKLRGNINSKGDCRKAIQKYLMEKDKEDMNNESVKVGSTVWMLRKADSDDFFVTADKKWHDSIMQCGGHVSFETKLVSPQHLFGKDHHQDCGCNCKKDDFIKSFKKISTNLVIEEDLPVQDNRRHYDECWREHHDCAIKLLEIKENKLYSKSRVKKTLLERVDFDELSVKITNSPILSSIYSSCKSAKALKKHATEVIDAVLNSKKTISSTTAGWTCYRARYCNDDRDDTRNIVLTFSLVRTTALEFIK